MKPLQLLKTIKMKYNKPKKRIFSSKPYLFLFGLAMTLLAAMNVNATTTTVSSVAALQTAINNASAGDVLVLANGTYLNNTLSISKSYVTVKAATSGGVFLNGTNTITIAGSHVVFSGFQFTSGDIGTGTVVDVTGSYNVVTQLNFSDYYASRYIHINDGSQYNEITFCNLEKKPALAAIGCTIQISTSPTVPGYHKIRYCSFQNYYGVGGDNGNEPIRIGLGSERDNVSRTIVEHCYFNNTGLGDSESVSVKSGENTIRFCTFTNQQNAMLCFRNGANNVAYSNFFINAGGIRVKESNNIYCYNNYFYNSGDGTNANAVTLLYVSNSIYANVLNNVNFIHNTFVNCSSIDLGGTGATNNTWANNIFKNSSGAIFTNANSGTTWTGNIRSGTLGISNTTGMAVAVDPLLSVNTDSYYGLSSISPAIDAASSSYPTILDIANIDDDPTLAYDISGQARPSLATSKDVGADEYTTGTTTNRPLAVTDVGPNYLGGPSITVTTQPIAASVCSGSTTSFTASSTSTLSPTTVQWQRSANGGVTWTNITANLDAATTYSGFTSETLVLTGSSSAINNYQYKAVFTNTIGSVDSNSVALTVVTTAVPTGPATKTFCGAATVASLTGYTGTALQWYTTSTGGSALATTTALTTGNYYVSQTVNGCESARITIPVTITSPPPTATSLLLCNGSTVSNLTATGTALKWYAAATGGSQLLSGTTLSTTTYYVSQTVSSCESARTAVSVTIYTPATLPVLNADGPGNTYELITSVLAPCQGVAAVEAPDMLDGSVDGTHPSFGRHIAEVMDADLGKYVFEFYTHVAEDNDITGGLDRERVEMKTYGGSTDNLKGVLGETVTYKWRFKVPTGFQPSSNFTHIHQVKAVDGDDSSPLFTLTPRYGTPNTLQLIYTQDSNTSTVTEAEVNLSFFENTWVEAVETIKIGTGSSGTYSIIIKKVSDGTTILAYNSNAIQTIRTSATDPATTGKVANSFIRPKWGIYRSLLDSGKLRDDSIRFSDISISEIVPPTVTLTANSDGTVSVSGVAVLGTTVTVQFPDSTSGTAVAGAGGAYGPITSGVMLTSGNVVVTYVSSGNTSPETIGQFTALPVVSNQTFCVSGTVANLTATGTLVKWYAASSGGSALATSIALANGTYYVTQTVNGIESARKAIVITINTTAAPVASAQTICGSATVASLVATGTALQWYSVATAGSALATSTALFSGTYYVSQTLNSCESSRTSVAVTLSSTVAPSASAQTICNSGTVANLTATGTALKWYAASTGGSALASTSSLTTATTYYVSQTLNSCESARVSSVVTISNCILSKQVLGEQASHDGGFEGQSGVFGTTNQSLTNNIWKSSTTSGNPTVTGVFNTTAPRSGNTYLTQTLTKATPAALDSGYSKSTFGASATTNVAKWVTFYYKPTPGVAIPTGGFKVKGGYVYTDTTPTSQQLYGSTVTVTTASSTYAKYSKAVVLPTNLGTSTTQLALYLQSVSGGVVSVDVDDMVIYDGTAEDTTAPNAPATATVANITSSSLDVNWTEPTTGGLDGGGYVVVRYTSNPNTDNDPNVNGIYAIGNTITNGTGSLVGTVVYIGTGTSFTDRSLNSSTAYYYKVYAVDKAFNYSTEAQVTGTTSGPLASPVATAATTLTADGFTANWGTVTNATSYDLYLYDANTQSNIVGWTFPTSWTAAGGYLVTADIANSNNTTKQFSLSTGTLSSGVGVTGAASDYAASASTFYSNYGTLTNPVKWFQVEVNTTGYRNIKVSSQQTGASNTSPRNFQLQYSVTGASGTFIDVTGGAIVCSNSNWTTGSLSNLALPAACDNVTSVFLRWKQVDFTAIDGSQLSGNSGGSSRIDNIYITGGSLTSQIGYPVAVSGTSSALSGLSLGTYYYDVIATNASYTSSSKSNLITAIVTIPQSTADYKSVGVASTSSATNWQYNNGTSYVTATAAPTSTNNITISSGDEVSLGANFSINSGKTITVNGTLNLAGKTISGAGTFTLSAGASLKLGDNTSLASAITASTTTLDGTANYFYDGTVAQHTGGLPGLSSGTNTITGNITVSNTAGVTLANNLKINSPGTLTVIGKLLLGDGNVTSATIGSGTFTYNGTGNFVAQTGATLSITSSKGISGTGNGSIRNTGTRTFASGVNYIFAKNDGVNAINMGTSFGSEISATTGINNLTINNPLGVYLPGAISTNAGEFTPDVDVTVNGVLNFVSGKLIANNGLSSIPQTTGTKTITIANSGSITGAALETGWVIGNLKKATVSSASPSFSYAIGDATNYTPLALTFSGTTTATGGLTARINTGDTSISGSGIDSAKSVNRSWTLTNDSLAGFGTYSTAFTYASSDNDAGTTPANYGVRKYENSTWSTLTISGTTSTTLATATGITSFGDFAIGETINQPIASSQTFCGPTTVANLVATGTSVQWYAAATGGSALASDSAIATGTYYVSQMVNSLESSRLAVSVTVNTTSAPTTTSVQSFCISNSPTVASLTGTGTALQWYTASTGGSALATTTALATGTYYVSQTVNTCESTRTSVSVSVVACSNLKIILKLDDFYSDSGSSTSTPTLDYLVTKKIKAGIGFVASRNDASALSVFSSYLNQTNSNGDKLFEVWHHGYDHISPEFDGTSYNYQKSHFEDANQLILDGLRVQMRSFGAPFNATDAITNTVVSENSNYKVTMFQNPAPNGSTGILNLTNRVNMESATGVPSYSEFMTNYNLYKNTYTDYMVLQGHPFAWTTPEKLSEFSQIIDFLIAEGVQFVTPFDYYLSLNPSVVVPTTSQTISFPALSTKAKGDADFSPGATSTSGLTVTYNSSNPAVATIVNGSIHIVGSGSAVITASQIGNATYQSANYASQTLTVTSREFRSLTSGNWNTPGTWQISDGKGTWTTSTTLPTALNNVYIQSGHTVTVNGAEAYCYDLHTNTTGFLAISGSYNVNVNGKIRAYTGSAEISTTNGAYVGTNTTTLVSTMISTGSTGVLKFVGTTRNITNSGEWSGSGTTNNATFALDSEAIGTLATGIKFKTITISNGTISASSTISVGSTAGNGNLIISSGAKLVSSRTYTTAGSQVITYSSTAKCGSVTIDGTLELTGAVPVIDCTSFGGSGIVMYSGGSQYLLSVGAGNGTQIATYSNLTVSGTGAKTLPTSTNITINGTLNFQETGINIVTGTNTLTLGTVGSITGAGTGWVVGNLIKQTASSASPSFVYPIGDATNYTPIALTFAGNTSAGGSIAASTTTGDHLQVATSGINSSKSVNRIWSLTNNGITGFTNYSAAFTYASADNDASTTPSTYGVRKFENSTWSSLTTSGTSIATAATATNITGFGDFAIGEIALVPPTATITPSGLTSFCSGGSVTLSANTGTGLTYLWSPGGATTSSISATASGSYTVKVTSTGGETTSVPTTITVNPNVTPTFAEVAAICTGENLSALPLTSVNGITGTWSPALDNSKTTLYTFTPTEGQCASTATLTITVNDLTTNGSITTSICEGDSYTWPANGQAYTTAQTGLTYTVGCNTATLNLKVTPAPASAGTNGSLVICAGTSVSASSLYAALGGNKATGGTWSTTTGGAGTYTYTQAATSPCTTANTATVTVTEQAVPASAGTSGSLVICTGTSVSASSLYAALGGNKATGGTWSATTGGAGIYTYTQEATSPCTTANTATVTVTEQAAPASAGTSGSLVICAGTSVSESSLYAALGGNKATGGTWSATTGGAGIYTYTQAATSPCTTSNTATVTVTEQAAPTAVPQVFCSSSNATIASLVASGDSLKWYSAATGGSALASDLALVTGNYYVTQTLNSCESPRSIVAVTVNGITSQPVSTSICKVIGGSAVLSVVAANPNATYQWQSQTPTGTTWVNITNPATGASNYSGITSASLSITKSSLVLPATSTKYRVKVTGSCSVPDISNSVTIIDEALPTEVLGSITSTTEGTNAGTYTAATVAVGPYVGTSTQVSYRIPAFTGTGLTYYWTVPAGVSIVGQASGVTSITQDGDNANVLNVNFNNVSPGTGTVGSITVQAQNTSGCKTVAKSVILTKTLPLAPATLVMTDGVSAKAITSFAKYMGNPTELTLTAGPVIGASSYVWELPEGVHLLSGATTTSGVTSGPSNVITVNFADVTNTNTFNYATTAAVSVSTNVVRIGVKAVNGVGSSVTTNAGLVNPTTTSTAKLLTLTAVAPAAPATLTLTDGISTKAITVVSKYIGNSTSFKLTAATSVLASSYSWELPTGVNRTDSNGIAVDGLTSNDPFIIVNFANVASATSSLVIGVKAINGVGSSSSVNVAPNEASTAKLLTLKATTPAAPATLIMTNDLVSTTTAVTNSSKFIGTATEFTLRAASSALANTYSWEIPDGVNVVLGSDVTSNSIKVNFANVAPATTSLVIGVKAINGVGSSSTVNVAPNTDSTAKLLTLTATAPLAPATLVLTDFASATPTSPVTVVSKYIGTSTPLKLTAAVSILANTYSWELPTGVNRTDSNGVPVDGLTSNDPFIFVNFANVPHENTSVSLYLGVKAVNGVDSSASVNVAPNATSTAKLLKVTAGLPVAVTAVSSTSTSVCNSSTGYNYTITPTAGATYYSITAPVGSVVSSVNGVSGSSKNILTTTDLTFNVVYSGTSAFPSTDKTLSIKSGNAFGLTATAKALTLTKLATCPTSTAKLKLLIDEFKVVAYPNPYFSAFKLDFTTSSESQVEMRVYDMIGKLIEVRQFSTTKMNNQEIGNNYPSAVYNVIITQGEIMKTLRVIKQ